MNIEFEKGLLGLEEYKRYEIKEVEDNESFKILQCIDDKDISFVVISPFDVKMDYEIELSQDIIDNLEIKCNEDVMLYSTVTLNSDINKTTVNLRAPLVINKRNYKGQQIIVNKDCYKIKHPLV